jgi:hypothetical protein
MKDARFRQPIDSEYSQVLGEAVFTFSILEWNAVWICERIQPGALSELNSKTAGAIAKRLIALIQSLDDSEENREERHDVDVRGGDPSIAHTVPGYPPEQHGGGFGWREAEGGAHSGWAVDSQSDYIKTACSGKPGCLIT